MSVYKEGYKAIEMIERSSKQIYSDACDFGAPTKKEILCGMLQNN